MNATSAKSFTICSPNFARGVEQAKSQNLRRTSNRNDGNTAARVIVALEILVRAASQKFGSNQGA